jgi:hypothetical protein
MKLKSILKNCLKGLLFFVCVWLVFVLISSIFFAAFAPLENAACLNKTADMGFNSRWSFLGGCQIEVEEERWIPLDNYYFEEE